MLAPRLFMLVGLGLPSLAAAKDATVVPFVASGVDEGTADNITGLAATELEFLGTFDSVRQVVEVPAGLDAKCVGDQGCLAKVAKSEGAVALIGGLVQGKGKQLSLTLVYFDGGKIVRQKSFMVENKTSVIADNIGSFVKETVTGVSREQEAQASSLGALDTMGKGAVLADDFAFEEDKGGGSVDLSDELTEDGELVVREDPPEDSLDSIEFAAAAPSDIGVEAIQIESAASFISIEPASDDDGAMVMRDDPDLEDRSKSKSKKSEPSKKSDPKESSRSARSSDSSSSRAEVRSPKPKKGEPDEIASTVHLTLKAGFTGFQILNFLTYGGELTIRPGAGNLGIVAGFDGFSVQREIPEKLREEGEPPTQWNTIFPIHAGAQYKGTRGKFLPYGGADLMAIPGYVQNAGDVALGLRLRGGADLLFTSSVGLNLDLNAGYLSGQAFNTVKPDEMVNGAPTFGATLGTIILF